MLRELDPAPGWLDVVNSYRLILASAQTSEPLFSRLRGRL